MTNFPFAVKFAPKKVTNQTTCTAIDPVELEKGCMIFKGLTTGDWYDNRPKYDESPLPAEADL